MRFDGVTWTSTDESAWLYGTAEGETGRIDRLTYTRLKEMMMTRARHVYVLTDSSKLGQRPFHAWARLPPSWTLVTDSGAEPTEVQRFRAAGVHVVVVDA